MATTTKTASSKETVATAKPATVPTAKAATGKINLKKATIKTKKVDVKPEAKKVLDTKNLKNTVKTAVTSMRQVKWKYPTDINDPLERKAWRGTQRKKLTQMEAAITTAPNDKAKKLNEKALKDYRIQVLLAP